MTSSNKFSRNKQEEMGAEVMLALKVSTLENNQDILAEAVQEDRDKNEEDRKKNAQNNEEHIAEQALLRDRIDCLTHQFYSLQERADNAGI